MTQLTQSTTNKQRPFWSNNQILIGAGVTATAATALGVYCYYNPDSIPSPVKTLLPAGFIVAGEKSKISYRKALNNLYDNLCQLATANLSKYIFLTSTGGAVGYTVSRFQGSPEIAQLSQDLDARNCRIQHLLEEKAFLENKVSLLDSDIRNLKEDCKNLQLSAQLAHTQLQNQVQKFEKTLQEKEVKITQLEEENQTLKNQLEELNQQIDTLQESNEKITQVNNELKQKIEVLEKNDAIREKRDEVRDKKIKDLEAMVLLLVEKSHSQSAHPSLPSISLSASTSKL